MEQLFFMEKVKNLRQFRREVLKMARQKNAKLFYCYVQQDLFRISTAKKVQTFDFSHFENDEEIIQYIELAIEILRENLPQQILLFDSICNSAAK